MKKIINKFSATLGASILFPFKTFAAVNEGTFSDISMINSTPAVETIVVNIIKFILNFSAALAVLFLIIGGIMYITSSGNDEKVKSAKKILTAAVIGLIIIIVSIVIVNVVTKTTNQVIKCKPGQEAKYDIKTSTYFCIK